MLTGRRSMDKSRPNGEHNLVEWAKPHLNERRSFYKIVDPRLEGNFSIKGAHRIAQVVQRCLCRDSKARPLMSQVVEALKPLVNLKDTASSSYFFQSVQAQRAVNGLSSRKGLSPQTSLSRDGQRHVRSLSNGGLPSPYHHQSLEPFGQRIS